MMNHPKMRYTYVGADSHKDSHTVVFMDCFFQKIGEIVLENRPSQFDGFLEQAKLLCLEETELLFGFEDVSAYGRNLTAFLLKHNQKVKHVNALLVARERTNQNVVQKSDAIDAECAARVLISKLDTLPDAPLDDSYFVLRSLVVRRKFLVKNITALKNHLYSLITSHYPDYGEFFTNIDCHSSLAFLERYPSPLTLLHTSAEELTDFFYEPSNGRIGMDTAKKIVTSVRENDYISVEHQETRDVSIVSTIRQIRFSMQELERLEESLASFLHQFDCTLTSMKGIDMATAASMLSCIGDIKRFPTPAKLARYSGIAPITYGSGKKESRFSSERGNRELYHLFRYLAVRVSMTVSGQNRAMNPFFYEYYQRKLSEGKTKRQALKCVQRRLVNIVWTMLTYGENYVNPPSCTIPKQKEK